MSVERTRILRSNKTVHKMISFKQGFFNLLRSTISCELLESVINFVWPWMRSLQVFYAAKSLCNALFLVTYLETSETIAAHRSQWSVTIASILKQAAETGISWLDIMDPRLVASGIMFHVLRGGAVFVCLDRRSICSFNNEEFSLFRYLDNRVKENRAIASHLDIILASLMGSNLNYSIWLLRARDRRVKLDKRVALMGSPQMSTARARWADSRIIEKGICYELLKNERNYMLKLRRDLRHHNHDDSSRKSSLWPPNRSPSTLSRTRTYYVDTYGYIYVPNFAVVACITSFFVGINLSYLKQRAREQAVSRSLDFIHKIQVFVLHGSFFVIAIAFMDPLVECFTAWMDLFQLVSAYQESAGELKKQLVKLNRIVDNKLGGQKWPIVRKPSDWLSFLGDNEAIQRVRCNNLALENYVKLRHLMDESPSVLLNLNGLMNRSVCLIIGCLMTYLYVLEQLDRELVSVKNYVHLVALINLALGNMVLVTGLLLRRRCELAIKMSWSMLYLSVRPCNCDTNKFNSNIYHDSSLEMFRHNLISPHLSLIWRRLLVDSHLLSDRFSCKLLGTYEMNNRLILEVNLVFISICAFYFKYLQRPDQH